MAGYGRAQPRPRPVAVWVGRRLCSAAVRRVGGSVGFVVGPVPRSRPGRARRDGRCLGGGSRSSVCRVRVRRRGLGRRVRVRRRGLGRRVRGGPPRAGTSCSGAPPVGWDLAFTRAAAVRDLVAQRASGGRPGSSRRVPGARACPARAVRRGRHGAVRRDRRDRGRAGRLGPGSLRPRARQVRAGRARPCAARPARSPRPGDGDRPRGQIAGPPGRTTRAPGPAAALSALNCRGPAALSCPLAVPPGSGRRWSATRSSRPCPTSGSTRARCATSPRGRWRGARSTPPHRPGRRPGCPMTLWPNW